MEFEKFLAVIVLLALVIYLLMLLLVGTTKPVEPTKTINATEYLNKMPAIRSVYQINVVDTYSDPAMEPRNMRY